jgi:hypothetical protein
MISNVSRASIAGTAGIFGLALVSSAAATLDQALEGQLASGTLDGAGRIEMARLVENLKQSG